MKRNIWPYAIISYFAVFITGIVAWVSFAMRHDEQLVRPDYYAHEIKYQDQIDRVARTDRTDASITYDRAAQTIRVQITKTNIEGTIHLYRPSDERLDQKLPITTQPFDVSNLERGFWKVRLNWTHLGREYYVEKPIIIDGTRRPTGEVPNSSPEPSEGALDQIAIPKKNTSK
jgi:hypothetical protein